jgi:hypothetical protein
VNSTVSNGVGFQAPVHWIVTVHAISPLGTILYLYYF